MQNMAHRHRRAALKMGAKAGPALKEYVILDTNHRPDLRGEFAGCKVRLEGHQHVVKLSETAARFYIDSGSIKPLNDEPVKEEEIVVE
jgi:hypothetical protein